MAEMNTTRRQFLKVAGAAGATTFLAACGGGSAAPAEDEAEGEGEAEGEATPEPETEPAASGPVEGGDLIVALSYEPDTTNVYATHLLGDVQAMMLEGLLVPNAQMEYVPKLAKEVPTVENGLIELHDDGTMDITYHLQEGVKWHDGEPLTSADVAYTWEALSNPDWEAESKDGVADIDSIDCPDDLTVVCHYNKQNPDFAQCLFTFGIMPKHCIEGVDLNDPTNSYDSFPIGTGPYKFVEWKRGEYIKLEKNADYWQDGAYMDSVTWLFVTDENTRINYMKTGEANFTYGISYTNYDQVQNIEGMNTITHGLNSWRYCDFNCTIPGLDDVAVRRAISCSINKQGLVDQLFSGLPTPCDQPWMPSDPFHVEGFTTQWSYDPDHAKQLLDEAGWVEGADGIREKDGTKLSFVVGSAEGRQEMNDIALVLRDNLKSIGIDTSAETYASSTWTSMMWDGEYELGVGGYITSPGASRTLFYASDGYLNRGKWVNEAFDEASYKIDSEMSEEGRKALVEECLAAFDDTLPQIVLYASTEIDVVTQALQGFEPNPTNMTNFCQSEGWWLQQ